MDSAKIEYEIGNGLKVVGNELQVDTVDHSEKNNSKPITANAVATEVGDLDALLNMV